MDNIVKEDFLKLVRLGIGNTEDSLHQEICWKVIRELADRQGLSAIVLDGVSYINEKNRPSRDFLLNWIGDVLQTYESRYVRYRQAISSLSSFYNNNGIKMMILKGFSCSINWPKPEHRPCGDIDIWLFGKYREADLLIEKEKGIPVDNSEHHHTVFYWENFMVENHYDFLNIHQHRSSERMEKIFKELGKDDNYSIEVNGGKLYLPSPNLHALFLLKHAMVHFAAESINLRQLLDWAFFVKSYGNNVDWGWLESIIEEYGMMPLYGIFNAICIEDLGFDSKRFNCLKCDSQLKNRVLNEILEPEFSTEMPRGFFRRIAYKYSRWKANEWKHALCYNEGMWDSFWSGVWNHITKPSTI